MAHLFSYVHILAYMGHMWTIYGHILPYKAHICPNMATYMHIVTMYDHLWTYGPPLFLLRHSFGPLKKSQTYTPLTPMFRKTSTRNKSLSTNKSQKLLSLRNESLDFTTKT